MAKYVVVQFDNDQEADAFTETVRGGTEVTAAISIVGIFKKPTLFCECPPSEKSVRGAKWGWWLHKDCGKPKRGNIQHPWNQLYPGERLTDHLYIGVREGAAPVIPS